MTCHGPDETKAAPHADFETAYHGLVTTITPLTDACREWLEENVEIEPWQRFGDAIAVEPRYAPTVVEEMLEAGFVELGA